MNALVVDLAIDDKVSIGLAPNAPESVARSRPGAFFCPYSSKLPLLLNKRATSQAAGNRHTRIGRTGEAGNGQPSRQASLNKTGEKVTSYVQAQARYSPKKRQDMLKLRKFVLVRIGKVFGVLCTEIKSHKRTCIYTMQSFRSKSRSGLEREREKQSHKSLAKINIMNQHQTMTNTELLSKAINAGNISMANTIANSPEYRAEVDAQAVAFHSRPKEQADTTPADNASKVCGFDFEGAILARGERFLHSI